MKSNTRRLVKKRNKRNVLRFSKVVVVVIVVVWEGCDATTARIFLHHGNQAYRQVNSLYHTLYNFDLPGRGQCLLINKAAP